MTLHEAIEQVIRKAGRPLSTREISNVINSRKLYRREDGQPVPTSQIGARVKNYPQWFKKVGTLIALAHDNRTSTTQTPRIGLKKQSEIIGGQGKDFDLIVKQLIHDKNYKPVGDIDGKVPNFPGLYMIRVKNTACLPKLFKEELERRSHHLLYVGIASKSLKTRMLGQELRAKGHGTFFRSMGAVLGYTPAIGSLVDKSNKRNYTFLPTDENHIIAWMNQNLSVNWVACTVDFSTLETRLIREYTPLINISKNPMAMPELSALRKKCVDLANTKPDGKHQ